MMSHNDLSYKIIGSAYKVHRKLGPGLLESTYEICIMYELMKLGYKVERQKPIPLIYDEIKLEVGYRIDLLVEGIIIIEIKSVESIAPVHVAQLLTYLRLTEIQLGLLINFNVALLKDGIKRVVNGLK
jgi:GxxExxY protein